jgi:hypothetical protein
MGSSTVKISKSVVYSNLKERKKKHTKN